MLRISSNEAKKYRISTSIFIEHRNYLLYKIHNFNYLLLRKGRFETVSNVSHPSFKLISQSILRSEETVFKSNSSDRTGGIEEDSRQDKARRRAI